MAIFLGVDAGGTQTTAALGDGVRTLGRGSAGSCKLPQVTVEQARAALHAAIAQACREAGVEPAHVESTCIGMAGASSREAAQTLLTLAQEAVPAGGEVVSDALIALEAAFRGGPGVVVIAGTGSMALGRNQAGEQARAGGWGPAASDEGSGYWIGRQAVAATLRAFDRAGDTTGPLTQRVLRWWQASGPAEVARAANLVSPAEMARLFPEVTAAAAAGDPAASDILLRAGSELAGLALAVARRLWPEQAAVQLAVSGGVLRNSPVVWQAMQDAIARQRPQTGFLREPVEPVAGALFLAQQAAMRTPAQRGGA